MIRALARLAVCVALLVPPWAIVVHASSPAQCTTDSECAAMFGGDGSPVPAPRLVGYGCEGAAGPIYAAEEDHFPACARIEPFA